MSEPEKCLKCGQKMSTHSFTQCVIDQRDLLAEEVSRLRRDDWVGGVCLHLMTQHGVPIGSPELLEAKARVEAEIETLRTANAALADQVKALKAVTEDPQALWTNWLRGTVKLPAGIGDIRQSEERAKRVLAAGDQMAAWLCEPRNLGAVPFMADEWEAAKGQP
jgi:hypothetical protein